MKEKLKIRLSITYIQEIVGECDIKEFVVQNKGKCMGDVNIQICRAIENKRERIDHLYSCLKKIGIVNLSFDFRYQNGKLEFIDWDTENDERVIAYLIGK